VSIEEQHIALPKLYGAPAYGRPPRPTLEIERPFDPDELPLEAHRTDEEQEFVELLPARAYAPGGTTLGSMTQTDAGTTDLRPRTFSLRGIAGRFLGGD
jgi:hypothetical protein